MKTNFKTSREKKLEKGHTAHFPVCFYKSFSKFINMCYQVNSPFSHGPSNGKNDCFKRDLQFILHASSREM